MSFNIDKDNNIYPTGIRKSHSPLAVIGEWGLNYQLGKVVELVEYSTRTNNVLTALSSAKDHLEHEIEKVEKELT
jgi:hypothetical protein